MLLLIFCLFAYFMGSLSSAIIVCKLAQLPDPRSQGSGNPGASNVLRLAGKKLASIVLVCDVLKGFIPVILAKCFSVPLPLLGWVAFFAFLGHLYPIFFRFKGGKGVATALGGLFALAWPIALLIIVVWLIMLILFRYISLASIVATLVGCLFSIYWLSLRAAIPILLIGILLIIRHRSNLLRLLRGVEPKFNQRI